MIRKTLGATLVVATIWCLSACQSAAAQEHAYGATWGGVSRGQNMQRFYHYPYVTYPQNYWGNEHYRSADDMYYRYAQEYRIPVYNRHWHNEYPSPRRYHWGHHFILDVF
jgi:hypothetical protein